MTAHVLRIGAELSSEEIAQRLSLPTWRVEKWLLRPLSYPLRSCHGCGQLFAPITRTQRFCCAAHREQHMRRGPLAERACELCGEPFTPARGRQRFCCPAHRDEQARQRRAAERTCAFCGERFTVRGARQRFCTAAHQQAHERRPRTLDGWREHVAALEARIADLHAKLGADEARATDEAPRSGEQAA
jgi:hypothetical protein